MTTPLDPTGVLMVTGASRGIGAATALLAASQGWAVAVNYHSNSLAADEVVRHIRAQGGRAMAVRVDVACRLADMTAARLHRQWATNVLGSQLCAREAVRRMSTLRGGQGGAIVNVSSVAAVLGAPGQYVDYAACKGAVDTFTVGLAREVAAEGVRVNAVRPGIIATDIHASGGQPDRAQRLGLTTPMQRPGQPEEVAQAIVWLLGPGASYTTGALLDVGGGR